MAGAAITVAALPFSSVRMTRARALLAFALMVVHLAACIAYFAYAQHNPSDSTAYYFDTLHFADRPFHLGTIFTVQATQVLRTSLGASYPECFIFFQAIGFWGVMLLMRSFDEVNIKMGAPAAVFPNYLLFLPSVHFWTVAIGKDAPLFFAVSLCVWSALRWKKRILPFGIALLIMVLFRAHIALIVIMALAGAAALHPKVTAGRKIGLLALMTAGALVLAGTIQTTLHVDVTNPNSLATFLAERNDIAGKVGGGTTFGDASLPVRFIALLFRPFFFDAKNFLGMIASVENVGSLLFFLYLAAKWRLLRFLSQRVFFLEFCAFFSFILITLLTLVNYNIGTGLRQRVMAIPPLFCVFVAMWVLPRVSQRFRGGESAAAESPPQLPAARPATELSL